MGDFNGGIVGVDNEIASGTQAEVITSYNSPSTFIAQTYTTQVDLFLLGGGGAGPGNAGNYGGSGGGGAGGWRLLTDHPVPSSPVTVTIGAGGATTTGVSLGANGSPSIFGSVVPVAASGGGAGALPGSTGIAGGSGGGGNTGGAGNIGSYSPPEGNNGGAGTWHASGGGGGGNATGNLGTEGVAGAGGNGKQTDIASPTPAPSNTTYGGGGGGGTYANGSGGAGGSGGGGQGAVSNNSTGSPGTVNLGGGGGGANGPASLSGTWAGGNGGSGKVVVKEKAVTYFTASGVWSLQAQYSFVKEGTWPS